jgi:hypothetical protein
MPSDHPNMDVAIHPSTSDRVPTLQPATTSVGLTPTQSRRQRQNRRRAKEKLHPKSPPPPRSRRSRSPSPPPQYSRYSLLLPAGQRHWRPEPGRYERLEAKKSGKRAGRDSRSRGESQASNGKESGNQEEAHAIQQAITDSESFNDPGYVNDDGNIAVHPEYRHRATEDASRARSETIAPAYETTLPLRGTKRKYESEESHGNSGGATTQTERMSLSYRDAAKGDGASGR